MSFAAFHTHGFVRVAAATVPATSGDPAANADAIVAQARAAAEQGADLVLFPELSVSSYAIDDLHLQDALIDAAEAALARIVAASVKLAPVLVVGVALRRAGRLYNTAVAIARGRVLGVVPKSYLPNYREYYEKRWFAPGAGLVGLEIAVAGQAAPFGTDLIFAADDLADFVFHIEICEDYWSPLPPSTFGALAGATLLLNLSASNITVGKARERALLAASQSLRAVAAYAYSAAGPGESTTDLAWDGQTMIHELGDLLAESERFATSTMCVADVDLGRIAQERMRTGTFNDTAAAHGHPETRVRRVRFEHRPHRADRGLIRPLRRFPYVPNSAQHLDQDCYEAFNIQVDGLAKRVVASGAKRLVIGVSGGLDSTHALIVAARTVDRLGLPRDAILGVTMPGFATGDASKSQAWGLMRALGIDAEEIDIRPAAQRMLEDIGHPFAAGKKLYDVTFENVQAGLRTDYLFRIANQRDGFVVGTGDLSELALGWCTYGVGDQMSHYAVNAGVPKTLIQYLIRWTIRTGLFAGDAAAVLERILAAEISPELVPPDEATGAVQSTEARIGPYALHDFFLYFILRHGMRPSKVAFLAWHAWRDAAAGRWPDGVPADKRVAYDLDTIAGWLEAFLWRFFQTSQFKRSALPNGPKVSAGGALSPRGDWRAPSDGTARVWVEELKKGLGRS